MMGKKLNDEDLLVTTDALSPCTNIPHNNGIKAISRSPN